MRTLKISTFDELWDFIDNGEEIGHGSWRWGSETEYRLEKDGVNYAVNVRSQPEHGISDCNDLPMEAYEVIPTQVVTTKWSPAPKINTATA